MILNVQYIKKVGQGIATVALGLAMGWGSPVAGSESGERPPTLDELLGLPPPERPEAPQSGHPGRVERGGGDQAEDPRGDGREDETGPVKKGGAEGGLPLDLVDQEPTQDVGRVFEQAVRLMDGASQRIAENSDTGLGTQRIQETVLEKLDQVIAAAEQAGGSAGSGQGSGGGSSGGAQSGGSGGGGGSGSNAERGSSGNAGASGGGSGGAGGSGGGPGQGRAAGGDQEGRGRDGGRRGVAEGDTVLQETRTEWGQLPPRVRQELEQGYNEPYSGLYRQMTEAYYRGLAGLKQQGEEANGGQ